MLEEALVLRGELAATNPVSVADLAASLNNLAAVLTHQGRLEEARAVLEEALMSTSTIGYDHVALLKTRDP